MIFEISSHSFKVRNTKRKVPKNSKMQIQKPTSNSKIRDLELLSKKIDINVRNGF